MQVLLIPNRMKDADFAVTRKVIPSLRSCGIVPIMGAAHREQIADSDVVFLPEDRAFCEADAVLTIGGDGTLLQVGGLCVDYEKPVLGLNLGRTGFLATCELDELTEKMRRLAKGEFSCSDRTLLEANIPGSRWAALAINDVTALGRSRQHPMDYHVYCDDTFVGRYRADGLIVATPTGSTAYSLSAGGPILDADAPVIVLTPVCAHGLGAVPLVFSAKRKLTLIADEENRDEIVVSADSRTQGQLKPGDKLIITKAAKQLKLITFDKAEQFCAMEHKLTRRE